jgi:hypothetical protein
LLARSLGLFFDGFGGGDRCEQFCDIKIIVVQIKICGVDAGHDCEREKDRYEDERNGKDLASGPRVGAG